MKKGHLELIKKINQSLILETIRSNQPISRAQIAKKLNLSKSTVSSIVDDLMGKKIVVELGFDETTKVGGRPAIKLGFNEKSAFAIGVDIGGTKILIVITDLDGNIVYKEIWKTSTNTKDIIQMVESSLYKSSIDQSNIIALGIGVPGIVDSNQGFVFDAPALDWKRIQLKKEMEDHFQIPIFVNNDVNMAALGEQQLGSGKNADDLVFVAIGTAVGSAIISKGELVEGHHFSAGEIGYLIDKEDIEAGKKNVFGQFGTFEKKTSGTYLTEQAQRLGLKPEDLFREYVNKNPKVYPIIEKYIVDLSIAFANIASLINPAKIIIGGGVSHSLSEVIAEIRERTLTYTRVTTEIELASLGRDAGALGAVVYAFQQLQEK